MYICTFHNTRRSRKREGVQQAIAGSSDIMREDTDLGIIPTPSLSTPTPSLALLALPLTALLRRYPCISESPQQDFSVQIQILNLLPESKKELAVRQKCEMFYTFEPCDWSPFCFLVKEKWYFSVFSTHACFCSDGGRTIVVSLPNNYGCSRTNSNASARME